ALKRRTGRDEAVVAFMERDTSTREFMDRLEDYLRYSVPHYIAGGKSYLTIALGCNGGGGRGGVGAGGVPQGPTGDWRGQGPRQAPRHRTGVTTKLRISDCGMRIGASQSALRTPQSAIR